MEGERKRKNAVVVPPEQEMLRPLKRPRTNSSLDKASSYVEWSSDDVQEYFIRKNLSSVAAFFKSNRSFVVLTYLSCL